MIRTLTKTVVVVALAAAALLPAAAADENTTRVPTTFPFDANVVRSVWLEGSLGVRTFPGSAAQPEATDVFATAVAAFALVPNLEVGGSAALISRNYDSDNIPSESGISDTLLWGKYAFYRRSDFVVSAGGLVSLPTGSQGDGLGTGNADFGGFISGGTRTRSNAFVQGFAGLRSNGSLDTGVAPHLSGKTSVFVGASASLAASETFDAFAAFTVETERYDGDTSAVQLTGGGRWVISGPWRIQVQGGVGFTDAAPRLMLGFGVVYTP